MDENVSTPTEAVIDAPTPTTPELGSQTPVAEKPVPDAPKSEAKKDDAPKSNEDILKRSLEKIKARDAEKEKAEAKVDAKVDPKPKDRDETGKFKSEKAEASTPKPASAEDVQEPKPATTAAPERRVTLEAPARFNENGKKDWDTAPETVKEEVHRALREMEDGYKKHKEGSEKWESVREWDDIARKNGGDLKTTLSQLKSIEDEFSKGPVQGMQAVANRMGVNLQALAAHIMGQNPNQQVQEAHGRIQQLEAEIQRMKHEAQVPNIVQQFFTEHEDAKDMSDDIAFVLEQGIVKDLDAAYQYVKRFKPASNAGSNTSSQPLIPAESAAAHTPAPALNPAGSKSVSGSPTNGISPASKRPAPSSNQEALQRAFAKLRA